MKILGVGLSRTGTSSLAKALTMLGFKTLHWCPERLRDVMIGRNSQPDWRRYDDVDAVTDLPAALFWQELLAAYPDAKCILTVRNEADWLRSMRWLFDVSIAKHHHGELLQESRRTQAYAYGSTKIVPLLYLKRYRDHNRLVQLEVPTDRLLTIDVDQPDKWGPLCRFLGVPVPSEAYPHANRSRR